MKKQNLIQWYCPECGSIHVQQQAWVDLNGNIGDSIDWQDSSEFWCKDCQQHFKHIDTKVFPCFNGKVVIEGYQVQDKDNNLHPDMEGSFCLYSLSQAQEMLLHDMVDGKHVEWKLLTCYKGDVEEPTKMYKGKDPRI